MLNAAHACWGCAQKYDTTTTGGASSFATVKKWLLAWRTWKCGGIVQNQGSVMEEIWSGKDNYYYFTFGATPVFGSVLRSLCCLFKDFAAYCVIINIFVKHALTFIVNW